MSLTAGALTVQAVTDTTATLVSAVATSGTAPYTYQWYRSTTTGFTPGAGNILTGQTSLTLNDTGLIPNTTYYWKVVVTDSVSATATSSQATALTLPQQLSQNQFTMSPYIGMPDLHYDFDTISALVSPNQATPLFNGMAVKIDTAVTVTGANAVPQVIGCTADSDPVIAFIIYDIKSLSYNAGDRVELSLFGDVLYLFSTTAINPFTQVTLDVTTGGGVGAKVNSSGNTIVGYAIDGASAAGQLIRVFVQTPSFQVA